MSFGGAAAGMVALVLALERRQIVRAFRSVDATRPEAARRREELGIRDRRMFRRLIRRGVLVAVGEGFFLDLEAMVRDQRRRRVVLTCIGLLALSGLAWAIFAPASGR